MFKFKNNPSNTESAQAIQASTDETTIEPNLQQSSQVLATNMIASNPTVISEGVDLTGNLSFEGTLYLDGKVTGEVYADKVNIGLSGLLEGKLIANEINISGKVFGKIDCKNLLIKANAYVDASIHYQQLEIQNGAVISGELKNI